MADLRVPDLSEFQDVNVSGFTNPVAIVRACYSTGHKDRHWDNQLNPLRTKLRQAQNPCGIYGYLAAGDDPGAAARFFCSIIGTVSPFEFFICDDEEGQGDQSGRVRTWLATVHQITADANEGWYSGLMFARAHNLESVRAKIDWLAAYQNNEPTDYHNLWQYSDVVQFSGVSAPCDASVFHGSVADLKALLQPAVPHVDTPPPPPSSIGDSMEVIPVNAHTDENGDGWFPVPGVTWNEVVNLKFNGHIPEIEGRYVPPGLWDGDDVGGSAQINLYNCAKSATVLCFVMAAASPAASQLASAGIEGPPSGTPDPRLG